MQSAEIRLTEEHLFGRRATFVLLLGPRAHQKNYKSITLNY